jgi:hypothetical protein
MIEAHAAETGRAAQRQTEVDAAPPAANHRWRAPQLNVCVAGLIVVLGGIFYVPEAGNEQSPIIPADEAIQARAVVIGYANANGKPMETPLEEGESGSSPTVGVEQERIDEGGNGTKGTPGAHSDDRAVVTPVVGQPIEQLGSDTENRTDAAAGEQMPSEVARTDSVSPVANAPAEKPSRDAASPPPVTPETRSAVGRADDPVVVRVARVISSVNMRAGPSNDQAVIATIPKGSPIEVVKCHQWCDVMFAGQRGWVYKTFISAPPADVAVPRTKPSPHRLKPATVRLSAYQGTRDAQSQSQSQSSSGNILWGTVKYLWNIGPGALLPSSN